jgi:hypothetical protein
MLIKKIKKKKTKVDYSPNRGEREVLGRGVCIGLEFQ